MNWKTSFGSKFFWCLCIIIDSSLADYDYYFEVGSFNEFTNSHGFGCQSTDCSVSKSWLINGTCMNPTLSMGAIETRFSGSQYLEIGIDGQNIGRCDGLTTSRLYDVLTQCTINGTENYNISKYFDWTNNNNINYINVSVSAFNNVNYAIWGYNVYVVVTISCDEPSNYTDVSIASLVCGDSEDMDLFSLYMEVYNGVWSGLSWSMNETNNSNEIQFMDGYYEYNTSGIEWWIPVTQYMCVKNSSSSNSGNNRCVEFSLDLSPPDLSTYSHMYTTYYEISINENSICKDSLDNYENKTILVCNDGFNNGYTNNCDKNVDYVLNLTEKTHESSEILTCDYQACLATKTWVINGKCENPQLTIMMAQTDYEFDFQTAFSYVNGDLLTECTNLDEANVCDLESCANSTVNYDLTQNDYVSITDEQTYLVITLDNDFQAYNYDCYGYQLYGEVTLSCCGKDIKLEIEFNTLQYTYEAVYHLAWELTDSSHNIMLNSSYVGIDTDTIKDYGCYLDVTDDDDCYDFIFYNNAGGSDSSVNAFYQLYSFNKSVTIGKQTFNKDETSVSMTFCFDFVNSEYSNDLFVEWNYDGTTFTIASINENNLRETTLYSTDYQYTIGDIDYNSDNITVYNKTIDDGCYIITYTNFGVLNDYFHGLYTVTLNDNIVGYGGYYTTSSDALFCTNTYDVSHCIVPGYCTENKYVSANITIKFYNNRITAFSYGSLQNVSVLSFDSNVVPLTTTTNCMAVMSCDQLKFTALDADQTLAIKCYGYLSCLSTNFLTINDSSNQTVEVYCYSSESCHDIENDASYIYGYGTNSIKNTNSSSVVLNGSFAAINETITVSKSVEIVSGHYSLFNTTIKCSSALCRINCHNNASVQYLRYDENEIICSEASNEADCSIIVNGTCNIATAYANSNVNNATDYFISTIVDLIDESSIEWKCNSGDVYDIGYPLYIREIINNTHDNDNICCRGYESCARASQIVNDKQNGNIILLGYRSCMECDTINGVSQDNDNNILCLAPYSCNEATIINSDKVVCNAANACYNSIIQDVNTLVCTMNGCNGASIDSVSNIYIFDSQDDVSIETSGTGEESYIYFSGYDAGSDVSVTCSKYDSCTIDCSDNACNDETTLLYCYGKCTVYCPGSNYQHDPYCVNIVLSQSPTVSPTDVPTESPTDEFDLGWIDNDDLTLYFRIFIGTITSVTGIIIISGYLDAKHSKPKNDIFEWRAIVQCYGYMNDFGSDIFFTLKLSVSWQYAKGLGFDNLAQYYEILMIASMIFIIFPIIINFIQFHKESQKWRVLHARRIICSEYIEDHLNKSARFAFRISIVFFGTTFAIIRLFNSNLFRRDIFNMGLPKYFIAAYERQRIYSVSLCEDLPQIVIKGIALHLALTWDNGESIGDASSLLITLWSLTVSSVSFLSSLYAWCYTGDMSEKQAKVIRVIIDADSPYVAGLETKHFIKFKYNNKQLRQRIAQSIHVDYNKVEILKPLQVENGVRIYCLVQTDKEKEIIRKQLVRSICDKESLKTVNIFQMNDKKSKVSVTGNKCVGKMKKMCKIISKIGKQIYSEICCKKWVTEDKKVDPKNSDVLVKEENIQCENFNLGDASQDKITQASSPVYDSIVTSISPTNELNLNGIKSKGKNNEMEMAANMESHIEMNTNENKQNSNDNNDTKSQFAE